MPTQSQPTALPTPFQTALKLADEISRLDLESITKERVQMTILIQRAIEQREAALVAENKRLREALTDCIDRLDHHDDQSVPEVVNARAALSGIPACEWPYITPGMEARAALAKEDV